LWPEAFKMVFKIPVIKDILFAPMNKKANFIYSSADYIVGVSETNCNRAKAVNETAELKSVFLGTNLDIFDDNVKRNVTSRNDKKLTIGYCGTLGHSYDLRCVFDALELVKNKNYNDIEFLVMGSGPLEQDFKQYCSDKKIDVQFLGRLPYEKMCGIISSCDICINPISKGSAASIINKHADYAASGHPVINTQESVEYRKLIEKYNCGINCECSNAQSVADAIMYLADNESVRKQMGDNARVMAEELFDRKNSYPEILKIINNIIPKKD
jgi:glycosyltransferase involved in cell wall biosynthesis